MRKVIIALLVGAYSVVAGTLPSSAQSVGNAADPQFEVLSPWAEVDPITPRGISPRLNALAGRRIGLFANFKRASRPIVAEVENRLKAIYPDCETSIFDSRGTQYRRSHDCCGRRARRLDRAAEKRRWMGERFRFQKNRIAAKLG
ncbi:MAG: hypothetical protein JXR49_14515 [Acidobacteria bacterium]|nr:hypothetical protein [Acidobacteriota bacterium]